MFPSQIEHVLKNIPEVSDQVMLYIDRVNHLDEMTIDVEINKHVFSGELSDLAILQNKIGKALHENLTLRVNVQLVEPGSPPRFERKAKQVVERRTI